MGYSNNLNYPIFLQLSCQKNINLFKEKIIQFLNTANILCAIIELLVQIGFALLNIFILFLSTPPPIVAFFNIHNNFGTEIALVSILVEKLGSGGIKIEDFRTSCAAVPS